MPPVSSSQHSVYCALPCWIRPRSLDSVALTNSAATGPTTVTLPRWLTSKMPTASRTAVCSFTTPDEYSSGIDQPPKSANFAPSATCRSCSGDSSGEAWAAGSVPSMFGTYRDYPAPVSTYTLRHASPAKTRCDAVVVGVVQSGKGLVVAPGGEDVAKEYGRALRPLLASLGVTGKLGEVTKVPTGKHLASPLLVLVGLGKVGKGDVASVGAVRRGAGAASRAVTNTASVAIALPAE